MSDVFISYSRRDIDFVRHLFDQLTARDGEPWADWQDIPPTADWLAEIDLHTSVDGKRRNVCL